MESSRSSRGLDSLEGPYHVLVFKDNSCSPLNDDPYRATLFLKSPSAQPLDIHCWTNHSAPQPETGQLSSSCQQLNTRPAWMGLYLIGHHFMETLSHHWAIGANIPSIFRLFKDS